MYYSIIDKSIKNLLKKGIDLKKYFESKIAFCEIQSESFPEYHKDSREFRVVSNKDTLFELSENYESIVGEVLEKKDCFCCLKE